MAGHSTRSAPHDTPLADEPKDLPLADEAKGSDYPDVPPQYTQDTFEEREVNVATVLKGTVNLRMNLFEKKAGLINAYVPS